VPDFPVEMEENINAYLLGDPLQAALLAEP